MPAGIVPRRRHEPYQYFLKASLLVAITVGWVLGMLELAAITFTGAWRGVAVHLISPALFQVHGQSQLVGWVGLFIMGIAYQVIPRQRRVAIHTPVLAWVVLALMLAGIALRAIAQPLAGRSALLGWLAVLSALLELGSLGAFMFGLIKGKIMNDSIQGPERFSRAALQWFAVALGLNLVGTLTLALGHSSVVPDWLDRTVIVVELFGFATSMIFGVNARNLPLFMRIKAAPGQALTAVRWLLPAAVIACASGQAVGALSAQSGLVVSAAGWAGLLLTVALYVRAVGLLGPRSRNIVAAGESRWYEAYVLAAYFWLTVGLLMELGATVAQLAGASTPAADLFLAGLHSVTVGFVSMMIMGMAARIVPAFAATHLYSQALFFGTWWCLMLGTALRVPSQALYTAAGGPFVTLLGVSGALQLAGLALFTWNLWATLATSASGPAEAAARAPVTIGVTR
ncbi:MAG TPA: NnrS family protein [Chloroflexota bacterium]|nr:NnrS family protein [Chloroflexota bacterium]